MIDFITNLDKTLELGDNTPQLANASPEPTHQMNYKRVELDYKCIQLYDSGYCSPPRDNWEAEDLRPQYLAFKTGSERTIE